MGAEITKVSSKVGVFVQFHFALNQFLSHLFKHEK